MKQLNNNNNTDVFIRHNKLVSKKIKKLVAFSLAEVLITLGIIGVVAATIIPSLVSNFNRIQWVTGAKKSYAMLSQAINMATAKHGDITSWTGSIDGVPKVGVYILEQLKINKNCGFSSNQDCMAPSHSRPFCSACNKDNLNRYTTWYKVQLTDGTSWFMAFLEQPREDGFIADFQIDTNGKAQPNQYAKDLMTFRLFVKDNTAKILPNGYPQDDISPITQCFVNGGFEESCTAWVVFNGNMDYLDGKSVGW